jgi:hypothetical protein
MKMRLRFVWTLLCLPACGGPASGPGTIRLVDTFSTAEIENAASAAPSIEPTEWRFDDPAAGAAWKAGPGVSGLAVKEGLLTGRSSAEVAIVHTERSEGLDDGDPLHEVVVRARTSKGSNLFVFFAGSETFDLDRIASRPISSPGP